MRCLEQKPAALVLSGGGALGAAHIGAVCELAQAGFKFDFFAGVSAGAIVSALLAAGRSPEECLVILRETRLFKLMFDVSRAAFGLLRGEKIYSLFRDLYGDRRFEDLSVPLYIGATDFRTGDRITISSGGIADAVRASVSVPILFEPFFHAELDKWLVDGGLTQNLPVDLAVEKYGGSRIISVDVATALDPNVDFTRRRKWGRARVFKDLTIRTLRIFLKSQQAALPRDPRILQIAPDLAAYGAIDVFKLDYFIEKGREAARAAIEG